MRHRFIATAITAVTLISFAAPVLDAQEAPPPTAPIATTTASQPDEVSALNEQKLMAIAVDFRAILRMAEFCDDIAPCAPVIQKVATQNLEALREPREDGSYRWASFQRIEAGRTETEKEIIKVHTESALDTVELTGKRAYRVVVTAPRKRSLLLSNSKVFVRDVVAEVTGVDGKTRTTEIPVGVWVEPGDAHSVPLDEIAISARAKVTLGVESGGKKAVASVALIEAALVDDAANPYYPAVKRLNAINTIVKEKSVSKGRLKAVADEAVLELPGEMEKLMQLRETGRKRMQQLAELGTTTGSVAVGDATPDVVHELTKASKLLAGTVTEQEEGRAALEALIQKLSPPPPPPAPAPAPTN